MRNVIGVKSQLPCKLPMSSMTKQQQKKSRVPIFKVKITFYFFSPFTLSMWMINCLDRTTVSLYKSSKTVELFSWPKFVGNNDVDMIVLLIISHTRILISTPACIFLWLYCILSVLGRSQGLCCLFFYFSLPNSDYFSSHISKNTSPPPGINLAYLSALCLLVPWLLSIFWSTFKWHFFNIKWSFRCR